MTRKRFRQGLAALTLLAAFLLLLTALLFAPTFASAGNDGAKVHPHKPGQSRHARHTSGGGYDTPLDWKVTDKGHWNIEGAAPDHCNGLHCFELIDGDGIAYGDDDKHAGSGGGDNSHGRQDSSNGYLPFIAGSGGFGGNGTGNGAGGQNNSQTDNSGKHDDDSGNPSGDKPQTKIVAFNTPDVPGDPSNSDPDPEIPPLDPSACPFADNCTVELQPKNPELDTNPAPNEVPEPLTLSIFAAGLAGSVALRRRLKTK